MIFKFDDKPIITIDSTKHCFNAKNISIILNFFSKKQKQKADLKQFIYNTIFLSEVFEKLINMLIKALIAV